MMILNVTVDLHYAGFDFVPYVLVLPVVAVRLGSLHNRGGNVKLRPRDFVVDGVLRLYPN